MSLTKEELLVNLMEECAEIIQAASKCLRFGYASDHRDINPRYGRNDIKLAEEIGDFQGVVDALPLDQTVIEDKRNKKISRIEEMKVKYGVANEV
jgi:hypothetical protein